MAAVGATLAGSGSARAADYCWDGSDFDSNNSATNPNNTVDVDTAVGKLHYRTDGPALVVTTSIDRSATLTLGPQDGANNSSTGNTSLLVMPLTDATTAGAVTGTHVVM